MKWLVLIVLAIAAAQLYVRLAPTSLETWNVAGPAKPPGDYSGRNWFEARRAVAPDVLGRLDVVAEETARTRRLGGDLTTSEGLDAAYFGYNTSDEYVADVRTFAEHYRGFALPPNPAPKPEIDDPTG